MIKQLCSVAEMFSVALPFHDVTVLECRKRCINVSSINKTIVQCSFIHFRHTSIPIFKDIVSIFPGTVQYRHVFRISPKEELSDDYRDTEIDCIVT